MIAAGDLKYDVQILKVVTNPFSGDSMTLRYSLRAKVVYSGGAKALKDGEVFNTQNIVITIYYRSGIDAADVILLDNNYYDIDYINPSKSDNEIQIGAHLKNK